MAKKHEPFYHSQKFWTLTLTVLFLATALFTAVHLRLATKDLGIADRWAENTITQQAVAQLAAQIRQQYPTLPDAQVQTEAQRRWDQYSEQDKEAVQQQSRQLADQFRSFFQYEAGTTQPYNQTYVLEMDPYHFWQKAENLANHGSVCDPGSQYVKSGVCIDSYRLAPVGTIESNNLHVAFEAFLIKTVQAVNSNLDTLTIIFYVPVILAAFAVIPAFFIGRKLAGNLGGLLAGLLVGVHPILMNRTIAGFSDTDGYIAIFSLFAVWFLLEAFEANKWWTRLLFAALAGLSIGLFAFAWAGWFFIMFVLIAALIAIIGYHVAVHIKHKESRGAYKDLLAPLAVFGVFLLFTALFVTLLTGFDVFVGGFRAPFAATSGLQAATATAEATGWPNILTTVAELNVPSLATIIGNLGGKMVVVLAAFGLFALLIDPRNMNWKKGLAAAAVFIYYLILISKGLSLAPITFIILFALPLAVALLYMFIMDIPVQRLAVAIIMMAWLLAVLFATTKGIRFLLLGIPPFAVGFGIAIGWIFTVVVHSLTEGKASFRKTALTNLAVGAILLLIIFNPAAAYNPIKIGKNAADNQLPGMNDAWWDAMRVIREQTPQDTIITSWWDFGHWFRTLGNRSVTFDGGSQNPEPGHLVGKILLTSNEEEAIGILRMLDCGQQTAYLVAREHMDVVPAKELIDELVLLDETGAKRRLAQTSLPAESQTRVLNYTHCTPPPAVFITSGDMIGKSGVWGHFGSWDFRRSMAYHYTATLPQQQALQKIQEIGYDEAQATEIYYTIRSFTTEGQGNTWISGWPTYITQNWYGCTVQNNTVTCPLQVGVAQTPQGTLAMETAVFNKTTPGTVTLTYGIYTNAGRLGGGTTQPPKIVLADTDTKKMTVTRTNTTDFNVGVLIRKTGEQYTILLADPAQTDSMFTQLYFLDGAFNKHFTKFVEREELGGSKITVWNVTWPN